MKKGDRMSDESAAALRRKVGGTAGGFFGQSIDGTLPLFDSLTTQLTSLCLQKPVKGKYTDVGYVSSRPTEVPYVPLLAITLLGVGAVLVAVVGM